jgi:AraC family transcriptional regulator
MVEAGTNSVWDVSDVAVEGHYLALNAGRAPLHMEMRTGRAFSKIVMPPGSLWLQPANHRFSVRVAEPCAYASVVLDATAVGAALGVKRLDLRPVTPIEDERLALPLRALVSEAQAGGPLGTLYAESLAAALSVHLAVRYGNMQPKSRRASLARTSLTQVLDFIEAHLGDPLSIERLARVTGSPFQSFARSFKAQMGEPPHSYVLRRRLERAREALQTSDEPLLALALRLGFSDQSHLTRLFRRRFGVPPGAFRRVGR